MEQLKKAFGVVVAVVCLGTPAAVQAQIIVTPETVPNPPRVIPAPVPGVVYYPLPYHPGPTNYSFNGPAPAASGYAATTTYYQAAPGGNLLSTTTTYYTPVNPYPTGYYQNYYSPLFFRY